MFSAKIMYVCNTILNLEGGTWRFSGERQTRLGPLNFSPYSKTVSFNNFYEKKIKTVRRRNARIQAVEFLLTTFLQTNV